MSLHDWRVRWLALRNRVLADPAFQRVAARFPLTRPVARRRAGALFDLVAGFTYSQTLFACSTTGIVDALAGQPLTPAELAPRIGLPIAGVERLLKAAAGIGITEAVGDRWTLGSLGAALRGNPGIGAMIAHHAALYCDLADPVAMLRRGGGGGALAQYWPYAESPGAGVAAQVAPYSALMAASQPMIAEQALAAYSFARHTAMLDLGGGEGAFLAAVGVRAPRLALGLFDLPAVEERARAHLASSGLTERTTFYGGNFLQDALPTRYDLITLVRILHDHDDEQAQALLCAIRAALPANGRLLIVEPMDSGTGSDSANGAYFGLYLLAMGSGRLRSPREVGAMLKGAGFRSIRVLRTPLPLIARAILATP